MCTYPYRATQEKVRRLRAKQWESESSNPILGHYWEDEERLDNGEKFLREYILNMGWKTKDNINDTLKPGGDDLSADSGSEDEEFLEKVDEFETKYNFRFEEEGGHAVSSHARSVKDSVRVKESKRKSERDRKKERKEEENKRKLMELQRLKNLKKQEIQSRVKEIEKVTGNAQVVAEGYLDAEFDPDQHDQEMEKLIGDDYYDQADAEFAVDEEAYAGDEATAAEPEDRNWQAEAAEDEQEEEHMWYYCDSCVRPIRPGNIGYDCKECVEEEVTICHNCKQEGAHPSSHKLKKFRVADHEIPPEDWQDILLKMKRKRTRDLANGKFDELYALDYEDLLGGEIPCRFKYTLVDSDSFGLSSEAILMSGDRELNTKVSLKKLHPYRKAHAMKRVRYHDGKRRSEF